MAPITCFEVIVIVHVIGKLYLKSKSFVIVIIILLFALCGFMATVIVIEGFSCTLNCNVT